MSAGFTCPQCSGHLVYDIADDAIIITMSIPSSVAARLDASSFMLQLYDATGPSCTLELSPTTPWISSERAQFQWVLCGTEQPKRALISVWQYDGTRHDLELSMTVRGAASGAA